jgi:hypothetical protein
MRTVKTVASTIMLAVLFFLFFINGPVVAQTTPDPNAADPNASTDPAAGTEILSDTELALVELDDKVNAVRNAVNNCVEIGGPNDRLRLVLILTGNGYSVEAAQARIAKVFDDLKAIKGKNAAARRQAVRDAFVKEVSEKAAETSKMLKAAAQFSVENLAMDICIAKGYKAEQWSTAKKEAEELLMDPATNRAKLVDYKKAAYQASLVGLFPNLKLKETEVEEEATLANGTKVKVKVKKTQDPTAAVSEMLATIPTRIDKVEETLNGRPAGTNGPSDKGETGLITRVASIENDLNTVEGQVEAMKKGLITNKDGEYVTPASMEALTVLSDAVQGINPDQIKKDAATAGQEAINKGLEKFQTTLDGKANNSTLDQLSGRVVRTENAIAAISVGGDKEARFLLGLTEKKAKEIKEKAKAAMKAAKEEAKKEVKKSPPPEEKEETGYQ